MRQTASVAMLERDAELERLALLFTPDDKDRRAVLVEGPAGIGKSSLLAAAEATAGERHLRVLHARGRQLDQSIPFGVVRQLFERTVRSLDEADREAVYAAAASPAAAVLEGVAEGDVDDVTFRALH